jgi:iron complex outermembrane receptor protein
MNILRDKVPGMAMPMDTKGTSLGYSINADIPLSPRDVLRVGSEVQRSMLDDWWPPAMMMVGSMGPDTLWNINHGRRTRLGTYGEWESKHSNAWTTLLGVRSDMVRMNTDEVAGYNMSTTTTGSAAYYADAAEFNASNHARRDNNLDLTALTRFEPVSTASFEIGYARKTRSPNLYERYLWVKRSSMSVQMNGWFGDANGYTGNLDLRPERADTLSATVGWHDRSKSDRELKVTPYYTFVHDYIDADRCPVIADSNGCTAAKLAATTGFVNLRFANHDARLYGLDVLGRTVLLRDHGVGTFTLAGGGGYVRGGNLDTGDNLYRVMPVNSTLTLEHNRGRWFSAVGVQAVAAKTSVQAARNELTTPAYALVTVRSSYQWDHLRCDAGAENLLNRSYLLPLGGRYWVNDKTGSSSVPGMGRSIFSALTVTF